MAKIKKTATDFYECSFCQNHWTIKEGFNLKTGQCASCDEWDNGKAERDRQTKERDKFIAELGNCDFPYVAGDPHW